MLVECFNGQAAAWISHSLKMPSLVYGRRFGTLLDMDRRDLPSRSVLLDPDQMLHTEQQSRE